MQNQANNTKDENIFIESGFLTTFKAVRAWLEFYKVKDYTIHPRDFTVEVEGDVNLARQSLKHIPVKFSEISGALDVQENLLMSLEFCPPVVGRSLLAQNNLLLNLDFCPIVGDGLYVQNNKINSLIGVPTLVPHNFYCHNNPIESLSGAPTKVGNIFDCHKTKIKNLEFVPAYIGGEFRCYDTLADFSEPPFIPAHIGGKIVLDTSKSSIRFEELKSRHNIYLIKQEKLLLENSIFTNQLTGDLNTISPTNNNDSQNQVKEKFKI